ncbi:MAG: hypothetical protein A4S09_00755 [Proteobacteria bacterium SG_bin7]|nr:MAG: hypothetical protein A4S09_00755 [Proteobacteria bacterium SG_bin7]
MKNLSELDGDLINSWYIAALVDEVRDKPVRRVIYDTPYVLFRDEKSQVRVFLDRCVHRGTQLSLGKCEKGGIRCPYHGWKFDGDGRLVEVPSNSKASTIPKDWKLKSPPQVIQDGCVWIWPSHTEPPELPRWRFPFYGEKNWAQYFMTTDFDNEVTHLVQNFMDVPHTVFVHDKWFRKQKQICVPVSIDVSAGRVKVTYHQKNDSIGFTSRLLNPTNKPMIHTDEYIFPNLTRVDYIFGDHQFIINSQCTPITRYKTRVYTWICYNIGALTNLLKPFLRFYTRQVIEQDVDIMKNQGSNLKQFEEKNLPMQKFYSSAADEMHLAIDRMREHGRSDRKSVYDFAFSKERELWI